LKKFERVRLDMVVAERSHALIRVIVLE